jgi:Na+-transporting NADH:ubiquinone oxidoreductase subunit NqrE
MAFKTVCFVVYVGVTAGVTVVVELVLVAFRNAFSRILPIWFKVAASPCRVLFSCCIEISS